MDADDPDISNYARIGNVDEITVTVRMVHASGASEQSTTRIFCVLDSAHVSIDEASALVESIAWNRKRQLYESYVLEQRLGRVNWGASGSGLQFVLDVASNVTAETILVGLAYVAGRLSRPYKKKSGDVSSRDELETHAHSALLRTFDLPQDDEDHLVLRSFEELADVARFLYEAPDGNQYRATVGHLKSGHHYVSVTKLTR